ncbi:hypothetical protein PoB_003368900 [Plakobranchus ocellatus]|uniref:Uncharacterized protein n=1 Tax=Plakobranchus ocellatus TaxID=259542 RepID=A0AAV4ALS4_9GAST|nr:hypothetical protein PoB_003368900 [Plakobranchus ocellatus]
MFVKKKTISKGENLSSTRVLVNVMKLAQVFSRLYDNGSPRPGQRELCPALEYCPCQGATFADSLGQAGVQCGETETRLTVSKLPAVCWRLLDPSAGVSHAILVQAVFFIPQLVLVSVNHIGFYWGCC